MRRVVESISMDIQQETFPPPPGLVSSILRGFDSVANHILLIIPPVLLDLFLWLGPHLRLNTFLQPIIDRLPTVASAFPLSFPNAATVQQATIAEVNQFNLFTMLRTFPIGITSLMGLKMPVKSPLGTPLGWDAGSFIGVVGWCLLLALVGWFAGACYYYTVSKVTLKVPTLPFWKSTQQAVLLSMMWLLFSLVFGLPIMILISVMGLISPFLGQVMMFILALLLVWLLMPIFFSAHGIFTSEMNAMKAILNSLRMVRFTLPNTGLFLLVFVVINLGLNSLWNSSPENSWLMLVGITGHAFISTALLAASFVYYRDINSWLTVVFEQLQRQTRSAKV